MLHEAGLLLCLLFGDAKRLREEREQHMMTVEHRHAVCVPFLGERDIAVIGLVSKPLLLERADGFVDRRFRDVELRRDVDRPDDTSVVPPSITIASR